MPLGASILEVLFVVCRGCNCDSNARPQKARICVEGFDTDWRCSGMQTPTCGSLVVPDKYLRARRACQEVCEPWRCADFCYRGIDGLHHVKHHVCLWHHGFFLWLPRRLTLLSVRGHAALGAVCKDAGSCCLNEVWYDVVCKLPVHARGFRRQLCL